MSGIRRDSLVLALHQTPPRFTSAPMGTSIAAVSRILRSLRERGYRFVGLDQVSPAGAPPGTVTLTADDGYRSQVEFLGPLLRELHHPWVVFVLAGRFGMSNAWDLPWISRRERHLASDDVERLAREGVTIGSHGMFHTKMTGLSDDALADELGRSREVLRGLSGQAVDSIAFPWGRSDARVEAAARRAGYRLLFGAARVRARDAVGGVISRVTLYATDQVLPLFAATTIDAPPPLRRLRGSLERFGRVLVDAAIAAQGRPRA